MIASNGPAELFFERPFFPLPTFFVEPPLFERIVLRALAKEPLARYATERLAQREHQLPAGLTFAAWFAQNENSMRANAALREKDVIVARQLLPLLEAAPENWEAVTFLNHGPRVKEKIFSRKLADWQAAAPAAHRDFIARVGAVFGLRGLG